MKSKWNALLVRLLPVGVAVIALAQGLWQFHHTGAVVFFGDDTFGHLQTINALKAGSLHISLSSPVLFEWFIWKWSVLFHTDIIHTYTAFAILSLPLMVLSVSLLARQFFNSSVAALTAVLLGLVSIQPVQTYQDGSIPNIYASGTLFPLAIISLSEAWHSRSRRKKVGLGALTTLLFLAMLFTHHFSTVIVLASVSVAILLFSVWLAKHLAVAKWRAGLPVLILLVTLWLFLDVIQPAAVLHIIHLVGYFTGRFPWFMFSPGNQPHIPWNAVRYGSELSGTIFQAALLALPLLLWHIWKEKDGRKAFTWLVVVAWLLWYWLGSLSTHSFEPDRLARDFALPGSVVAAYFIWWTGTRLLLRYRLAAQVLLVVLVVGALFSAQHRWSLMNNQPAAVYSAQDENIAAALAPLADSVAVYSTNYYWQAVAGVRGATFTSLDTPRAVYGFENAHQRGCIVQIYYTIPIAGAAPNPEFANPLPLDYGYDTLTTYEDASRRLFLSCTPKSSPTANIIQNK